MRASILDSEATKLRTRIVNPYPEETRFLWDRRYFRTEFIQRWKQELAEICSVPYELLWGKE